ncbi:hypothetical protein BH10BAC2_BH10BAC2_31160 [soil metagenome]
MRRTLVQHAIFDNPKKLLKYLNAGNGANVSDSALTYATATGNGASAEAVQEINKDKDAVREKQNSKIENLENMLTKLEALLTQQTATENEAGAVINSPFH